VKNPTLRLLASIAAGGLLLASCASQRVSPATSAEPAPSTSTAAAAFPVTVKNCGRDVVLKAAPKRIFLVNNDDVALLDSLDAVDLVVARTAELTAGVYSDKVTSALAKIPLTKTETNATGGSVISTEAIQAAAPDLVLAPQGAVDAEALAASGIAAYSPPAYCADSANSPQGTASFDWIYDQLTAFGTLLGKAELASQRISELKAQVATPSASQGSAVALYVPTGGGALYPYGAPSMVTPIFAAAGLENVYAGSTERVFEVNLEDLLQKDPKTVVLLYSDGSPETAVKNFESVNGVKGLSAVKNRRVIALQFPFTDPPTPLSIQGVSKLAALLATLQ
jgi:ABC-type Fe3+-hydroxamate transport system, periplasmic component